MKLYKIKLLIAAVPYAAEWTVDTTDPGKALSKAKIEMKRRGIIPCIGRQAEIQREVLSVREI